MKKLEKRIWPPQWYYLKDKREDKVTLDIPVPCKSPSILNSSPDYKTKTNFLEVLGLKTVPAPVRQGTTNLCNCTELVPSCELKRIGITN